MSAITPELSVLEDPQDVNNSAYKMCILFGITCILPYNVIVTSVDIFENKVIIFFLYFYIVRRV